MSSTSAVSEEIKMEDLGEADIDKSPIMWAIAAILFGSLFYTVYKSNQEIEDSKQWITGTVIPKSEVYVPASSKKELFKNPGSLEPPESDYYFSMETPLGKKVVQVHGYGKEGIESLISDGSKVEARSLDPLSKTYHVNTSDINVR